MLSSPFFWRWSSFGGAAVCFLSLAIAYFYMERYLELEPCPLCILDRIVVVAMGLTWIAQGFLMEKWRRTLVCLNAVFLSAGFVFAIRHVWLQNRPPEPDGGCLLDVEAAKTFTDIIGRAFDASGDCGAILWRFAGFTIPEQVLIMFCALALLLALQAVVAFRRD